MLHSCSQYLFSYISLQDAEVTTLDAVEFAIVSYWAPQDVEVVRSEVAFFVSLQNIRRYRNIENN